MNNKGSNKAQKINSPINGLELSASDFASAVLNNSSDGITAINLKGEILFWNEGAVKLSGYTKEEVLGKNISIMYRKQDIPDLVERISKAKQGEFFTNKELIMIDKEGKEHQVLLTLNGLTDNAGNITTLVGVTKDITDLKLAERTIQESEQRFQQAFNNSPIPISILNLRTGKRLAVNKTFTDVFGYTEEDLIGEDNIHKVNIAVEQEKFKLAVKKLFKEGFLFEFPFKMYTKSGEIRHALVNATRVYPDNKDVYITSYLDVTERKKSKEALINAKETAERSEKFLENILNNIGDPVFVKDDRSRLLLVNDAFCKLFGLTRENILGKTLAEDVSAEEMEAFLKIDQHVLETGEENVIEETLTVRGGETKTIDTRKTRYVDGDGKRHLIGVIRDLTKRKNAELELKRAQEIAHIGNWYLDLSTGAITWSDELYKMYGFDPVLPIPPLSEHEKFLTPESWELLNTSIEHTRKTGKPYAIELKINNELGDDVWQWFYAKGEAVFDSKNTIIAIRGTAQDITDRKIAEERIKESEASINTILNSLPASVCVIDGTGKILQVNNSWVEFGELNGMPKGTDYYNEYNYFDVCKKDLQNEDARSVLRGLLSLAENKITEFEHEYPCHSPERKQWFSLRAKLMKSKDKQIVISHIDITSRKLAEENIKETLTQLNVAVDTAKIGVWSQNVETGELTWNSELFSIFGLETSEFDYSIESFLKMVHPEDIDYLMELQEKLLQNKTIPDFNYRIFRPSGEVRYIQASATPILDDKQNLIKIVGIKLDLTEERKAEEKLEKANKELMHAVSTLNELRQQIEAENIYLKEELRLDGSFNEIVGSSPPLRKMLRQVQQVAKTDSTVLILGETGTGKELIARAIHDSSNRKDKPMVKVNCSALPAELIESEFFGHEAGAFTSAIARKIGRFELANGGTIFLDEIGDLPIGLQTRLLRVLQENEFERVGGEETIKIDVRVITATNTNLEKEVINGNFRQDLYYRLNVFPITCPPLRKRKDDIPDLVNHFVNKYNQKLKKNITSVSQKTIDNLIKYKWPGNIRELEHVIERSVIVNKGSQLLIGAWFSNSDIGNVVPDELTTLEDVERNYITKVLDEVNWKIRGKNGAAEILGLKPTTLESRMKKWNISRKK